MIILRASEHKQMPWLNGGGITTELWKQEADGQMLWRLSMADVAQSGPFSIFAGVDRVIGHLEGGAMRLTGTASDVTLLPGLSFAFSGDEAIMATIAGPCRDFNLMMQRGRVQGDFAFVSETRKPLAPGETAFVFALADGVSVNGQSLSRHDLALVDKGALSAQGEMIAGSVVLDLSA